MSRVLLISPELSYPVDPMSGRSAEVRELEKVANLGLLSVATYLDSMGIDVKLLDLVGVAGHLEILENEIVNERPRVVGFSCISCFSYATIAEYSRMIKSIDDGIFLLGGGQHLSAIPYTALLEIPELDCVIKGEGELLAYSVVSQVLRGEKPLDVPQTVCRQGDQLIDNRHRVVAPINLNELPLIRYDLLPGFQDYGPEIEFSRGCPWSCNFCTDPYMFNNRVRYKSAVRFIEELSAINDRYSSPPGQLKMFFTCSTFGIRPSEIENLITELRSSNIRVSWRTETRVDSPTVNYIDQLAEVGMRVLDIGLESASPTMLEIMNKTKTSKTKYLDLADTFIKRVGSSPDVSLKINVVFHAGESPVTLAETVTYLLARRQYIDCVSAGPVMMYPGTELGLNFTQYAERFGTSLVEGEFWDRIHAYEVNPSYELSFAHLNEIALALSKMLTTEYGYYLVKSHGQLPLSLNYQDWKDLFSLQDGHQHPFSFDISKWPYRTSGFNPLTQLEKKAEHRPVGIRVLKESVH